MLKYKVSTSKHLDRPLALSESAVLFLRAISEYIDLAKPIQDIIL